MCVLCLCCLHVRPSSLVNSLFSPPPLALRALCALCLPNWGVFSPFTMTKRHFSSSKQSCSVIVCWTYALGSCDYMSAVVTVWSPLCIDRAWGQEVKKNPKPFNFFFSEKKTVAENVVCWIALHRCCLPILLVIDNFLLVLCGLMLQKL